MGSRSYKCNNGLEEGCENGRINSAALDLCHNFIGQDFCVDATVGLAPPTDDVAIQQFIQNTIYQYAPGVQFPTDPIRLIRLSLEISLTTLSMWPYNIHHR
jgi:hypothetical protein